MAPVNLEGKSFFKFMNFIFRQSLLANLTTVAIFVLGLWVLSRLPLEVFPSVNFDVVTISTAFPGASPEQVERLVTNPIEDEVKTVFGIRDLFSSSVEGASNITVVVDNDYKFKSEVLGEIQRAVDRVEGLPPEVLDRPVVQELKSDREPSIVVGLIPAAGNGSQMEPSLEHRQLALDLKREIESLDGIGEVRLEAEQDLEFLVDFDTEKLKKIGISVDEVVQAFRNQNLTVPGGEFEYEDGVVRYRIENELTSLERIRDVILRATIDGQIFRVRDLAEVSIGLKKAPYYNRAGGRPAQILQVIKQQSADVIELVDGMKVQVADFIERVNRGKEIENQWQVVYGRDLTIPVRVRNEALATSILIGGVLVFLTLLLALHWKTALIVAVGIPFSFLGAILLMPSLDYSLNLLTMFGFVVVLGMIVDDAIVVAESIFSRMEQGEPIEQAVTVGTWSVFRPVIGSVTTTILAFAPLVFMSGIFGQFVKYIPMIVILCLVVSLLEAFFLLPNHMRDFARVKKADAFKKEHWFDGVRDAYRRVMLWCMRRRYYVVTASVAFLIFAGIAHAKFGSFVLFPKEGIETFYVTFEGDAKLSHSEMLDRIAPIEKRVLDLPKEDVLSVITSVGQIQTGGQETREMGSNYAQISVFLRPSIQRELDINATIEELEPHVKNIPDMINTTIEEAAGGPPVGRPVNIIMTHDSLETLEEVAELVKAELEKIPGTRNIGDSNQPGKVEATYDIDFERASQAGTSASSVGLALQIAVEGAVIDQIRGENERMGLRIRTHRDEAPEEALKNLRVLSATQELVPVSRVIRKKEQEPGRYLVTHYQNQRSITVYSDVDTTVLTAGEANQKISEHFEKWQEAYPGLKVFPLGENRDTAESFQSLTESLTIAVILVIFVVILTLKSIWQPIVVLLTSVPLGIAGVLIIFIIHQRPLSFLAAFGLVGLIGVAVNVGIVLIDRINSLAQEMKFFDALMEGSAQRLRAVLLTSLTTILGLMPTAYGWGGGDPFLKPMALALGWGIAFATISGIVLTPLVLGISDDVSQFAKRLFSKNERAGVFRDLLKAVFKGNPVRIDHDRLEVPSAEKP